MSTPELGSMSDAVFDATLVEPVPQADATIGKALEARPVVPGALVGRYVVLSQLGAGAMGVVLAAYDPELDRKVALKLLRDRTVAATGQARLKREAQALARLDHANVVGVHDVGSHDGRLYLAMDFVEGQTLGAWIRGAEGVRPWPEVLAVFEQAGRGLAAAHRAGLLHRDFKPDNVMLGEDGRARVMDFGLARTDEGKERGQPPSDDLELTNSSSLDLKLTQTGALMGTPAYMAPELMRGGAAESASDQFAFCVALHEALYGVRPFKAKTYSALVELVGRGEVRPAPRGSKVPSWVRRVVLRGLEVDPKARWPDMDSLLAALVDDPARRWRRRALAAGFVALAALGVGAAVTASEAEVEVCELADPFTDMWGEGRRAKVEEAILATGVSYATSTSERIELGLDRYASAWRAVRNAACEANHSGGRSDRLYDKQVLCLERQLTYVDALIEELTRTDADNVARAGEAIHRLPLPAACEDTQRLLAAFAPPEDPEVARRVDALEIDLAQTKAKHDLGHYEEGVALARKLVAASEELDYLPLIARARLRLGYLEHEHGDYESAEATLRAAYDAALTARMHGVAASAASELMTVLGDRLARFEDAERWAIHAAPLSRSEGPLVRATYFNGEGVLALTRGDHERAQEMFEQALSLRESALGSKRVDLRLATIHSNLGIVALRRGDMEAARARHERALEITKEALGPAHPNLVGILTDLGSVARAQGELEQAQRRQEQALALGEATLGPEHPRVGQLLDNLGIVMAARDEYQAARELHERALVLLEKGFGPEHPSLAITLNSLGIVAQNLDDLDAAQAYFERSLAIDQATYGPEHPYTAMPMNNLAEVKHLREEFDAARALSEQVLALLEAAHGPEHPLLGYPLFNLGLIALDQQEFERAQPYFARLVALREASEEPESETLRLPLLHLAHAQLGSGRVSEAEVTLARLEALCAEGSCAPGMQASLDFLRGWALSDGGGDRQRALALVRAALGPLKDENWGRQYDAAQAWLERSGIRR